MISTQVGNDIKVTLSTEELKNAFTSPRNYYNFMKELHKKTHIPFFEEAELLEWVLEEESKENKK